MVKNGTYSYSSCRRQRRYVSFFGPRIKHLGENEQDFALIDIEDAKFSVEMYLIINRRSFINRAAETFIEYAKEKLSS
jgi:hypothetical protein